MFTIPARYAQTQINVPISTHVHGAEVLSDFDGGSEQWFTANGLRGADYRSAVPGLTNAAVYDYSNDQKATTIWYYDHALGITRFNVMSGLAGFYLIRDPADMVQGVIAKSSI
ncbi:MAG: multicopper oxidase domain-containing protein [Methanoregula sp.]|nr:multicopper oxidase domain-containing protein [Methanoregula sp.]